jgi:hypothetical protein
MFSDDNWGTIRRLPKKDELGREGGYGVCDFHTFEMCHITNTHGCFQLYHHLAYVGVPKAYKWHNTNNLVSTGSKRLHYPVASTWDMFKA